MFFEGFGKPEMVEVVGEPIRLRRAGHGPAVLLLHGHPQTHAMWHALAPRLAGEFTVVCPDLPGYGGSRPVANSNTPAGTKDGLSRRMFDLLSAIGIERVSVVGHDRGGSVAHHMARSWPERVQRLAVLDVVPTPEPVEPEDMATALATYRTFWFAQTHPKPDALFQQEAKIWLPGTLPGAEPQGHFHPEAIEDYLAHLPDTEAMAVLNECYRVSVERDLVEDRLSGTGSLLAVCPILVLWGAMGRIGGWHDPVRLWRARSSGTVSGMEMAAGHFMVEEQPASVAAALLEFLQPAAGVNTSII